ncbi:MAG: DUF368 domain-containing protein [Treponemataceae bacterium]
MNLVFKFLAGIFIGIANVIPGVSGGTIAVILNVYEELLTLTSLDIKKIRASFKVLLFLCCGIVLGILFFAQIMTLAYEKFPIYTNFFFVGIIAGSVPFLFTLVKGSGEKSFGLKLKKSLAFFVAFALMLALFFAKLKFGSMENSLLELSFTQGIILFFVGIVAAIAMLLPGISGSFLLLLFGYYKTVMHAISNFQIPVLLVFGFGVLTGLVLGSRIIMRVLKTHSDIIYSAIFGLVLGSVIQIIPFVNQQALGFVISALCFIAGFALVFVFTKMSETTESNNKV